MTTKQVKTVSILGATGSVGRSAIDLIYSNLGQFQVEALVAHKDAKNLALSARKTNAKIAVIADPAGLDSLRESLAGTDIEFAAGEDAVIEAASRPVDLTISAIVGAAGLRSTAAAVKSGNDIALANKECMVCGGLAFKTLVETFGVRLLPVDSEHNALFQLLQGKTRSEIKRFTLTASGGPFRSWSAERLAAATRSEALNHPTWSMGDKITIDSATLMNKGLELIEAYYLFDLAPESLDVLVHPQSIVHALVTLVDGSTHAEMGPPDMRRPLAHCLAWPERINWNPPVLDLAELGSLTFSRPDESRFPALKVARQAMEHGDGAPNALNASNEIAVNAFLNDQIPFTSIVEIVEESLATAEKRSLLSRPGSIVDALELDQEARRIADTHLQKRLSAAS